MQQQKNCWKLCYHADRRQEDSIAIMKHVILHHQQQQRDDVFCWVREILYLENRTEEVSIFKKNMVVNLVVLGPENDWAGEDQKQL
jgi:hypothetical protein